MIKISKQMVLNHILDDIGYKAVDWHYYERENGEEKEIDTLYSSELAHRDFTLDEFINYCIENNYIHRVREIIHNTATSEEEKNRYTEYLIERLIELNIDFDVFSEEAKGIINYRCDKGKIGYIAKQKVLQHYIKKGWNTKEIVEEICKMATREHRAEIFDNGLSFLVLDNYLKFNNNKEDIEDIFGILNDCDRLSFSDNEQIFKMINKYIENGYKFNNIIIKILLNGNSKDYFAKEAASEEKPINKIMYALRSDYLIYKNSNLSSHAIRPINEYSQVASISFLYSNLSDYIINLLDKYYTTHKDKIKSIYEQDSESCDEFIRMIMFCVEEPNTIKIIDHIEDEWLKTTIMNMYAKLTPYPTQHNYKKVLVTPPLVS